MPLNDQMYRLAVYDQSMSRNNNVNCWEDALQVKQYKFLLLPLLCLQLSC